MKGLSKEFGTAVMLITHDLGVVAGTCQHVNVMYAGHVVESAPVKQIFETPAHPYTVGLLQLHSTSERRTWRQTYTYCRAAARPCQTTCWLSLCATLSKVQSRCREERPELMPVGRGEQVAACFYPN